DNAPQAGVRFSRFFSEVGAVANSRAGAKEDDSIKGAIMKMLKGTALALLALGLLSTAGCDRHSTKEIFYMVAANQALPYWQAAAAGFNKAAAQYKVTSRVVGPDNYD